MFSEKRGGFYFDPHNFHNFKDRDLIFLIEIASSPLSIGIILKSVTAAKKILLTKTFVHKMTKKWPFLKFWQFIKKS